MAVGLNTATSSPPRSRKDSWREGELDQRSFCLSMELRRRRQVLDCASPLALLGGPPTSVKRQGTAALQNTIRQPPLAGGACPNACLEFGHLPLNAPSDAKGVSSYQPGAAPGQRPRNRCYETGRWPSMKIRSFSQGVCPG